MRIMAHGLYSSTALALLLMGFVWLYGMAEFSSIPSYSVPVQSPVGATTSTESTVQFPSEIPPKVPSSVTYSAPEIPQVSDLVGSKNPDHSDQSMRPLITYAYFETPNARQNLEFFIDQGLHGAADFIFIMKGETNASDLIPDKPNIRVLKRPNECFDLGSHGEVLKKDGLWKKYKRFITLNASIRGPFIPHWAKRCWTDVFLSRLSDKVKLVGVTANCFPKFHVQSMIWATDSVGMELLLYPPEGSSSPDEWGGETDMVALEGCYADKNKAIHGEIGATGVMRESGYEVDVLMAAFHRSKTHEEYCAKDPVGDILFDHQYFGTNIHPYETIFMKSNRGIDPILVDVLTEWHRKGNFNNSWDVCV